MQTREPVAVTMNIGPLVLTNIGPPPDVRSVEPGRGPAQQNSGAVWGPPVMV